MDPDDTTPTGMPSSRERDTLPAPAPDPDDVPTDPGSPEGKRRSSARAFRALSRERLEEIRQLGSPEEAKAATRALAELDAQNKEPTT